VAPYEDWGAVGVSRPDPNQLETRLLVVTELLDRAVKELGIAVANVRGATPETGSTGSTAAGTEPSRPGGETDDRT
jgi:hypothetical protein